MRESKIKELNIYINELKLIGKVEIESQPNFLSIKKHKCTLNNGQTIIREELVKGTHNGHAAVILPITENGEILLVVEPRVYTKEGIGIGLPAGYIEANEEPSLGALRELEEETGYKATNIIEIASFYQDEGCSSAYNHSFIAYGCKSTSRQQLDSDEFIKYFTCTYKEALELIELGFIKGSNSILTLEKAKTYMKGGNYGKRF